MILYSLCLQLVLVQFFSPIYIFWMMVFVLKAHPLDRSRRMLVCFFLFTFSFVFILFLSSTRRVNIKFYSSYEIDSVEYDWPANKVVRR